MSTGNNSTGDVTLQQLVDQSGILTNINLPGINYQKQQVIQNAMNSYVLGLSLDITKAQVHNKDTGTDILISLYYNGELLHQVYYSQLNIAA